MLFKKKAPPRATKWWPSEWAGLPGCYRPRSGRSVRFFRATTTTALFRLTPFVLVAFYDDACPSLTRRDCQIPQVPRVIRAWSDAGVAPCGGVTTEPLSPTGSSSENPAGSIPDSPKTPLAERQYDVVGFYPTHPMCNYRRLLCHVEDGGPEETATFRLFAMRSVTALATRHPPHDFMQSFLSSPSLLGSRFPA
jgi:hypothetical protein